MNSVDIANKEKFCLIGLFKPDHIRYDGVRKINIYLMRVVFLLTFLFIGTYSWQYILTHNGASDHVKAVAFCVWAAYSLLSLIGLYNTLKMIPLMLFQILYKVIWLAVFAYPRWETGELTGGALGMAYDFIWVILPIIAVPWGYVFRNYFLLRRKITSL